MTDVLEELLEGLGDALEEREDEAAELGQKRAGAVWRAQAAAGAEEKMKRAARAAERASQAVGDGTGTETIQNAGDEKTREAGAAAETDAGAAQKAQGEATGPGNAGEGADGTLERLTRAENAARLYARLSAGERAAAVKVRQDAVALEQADGGEVRGAAEELDALCRRDARRYDGGFRLYEVGV